MPKPTLPPTEPARRLPLALVAILTGTGLFAVAAQTLLQNSATATIFLSSAGWQRIVAFLGGSVAQQPNGQFIADVALGRIVFAALAASFAAWMIGAWWISRGGSRSFNAALGDWGTFGWLWALFAGSWEIARIAAFTLGLTSIEALLLGTPHIWFAIAIGGWFATLFTLAGSASGRNIQETPVRDDYAVPSFVWIPMAAYVVVFTAMNWQLYRSLLLPHGDSAMYEEHLWNVLHGKGFRSYLDQGLFLGEHVQVVHLLLLPLYLIWPSHLLLELCQSVVLAAGAIPIYWLARRHTGWATAGVCLAAAYLLYFPMQFLDIAIDLKTFRPNAFGVPMLLFALDQFERRNYKSMIVWLLLTLTTQEDWSIILACLGGWIALQAWFSPEEGKVQGRIAESAAETSFNPQSAIRNPKSTFILGLGIALFNSLYLVLATRVIILWFRDWKEIHYAGYFSKFGHSLTEVVKNMVMKPGLTYHELADGETAIYILAVFAPLGFIPLLSPCRLLVALPVFITLCLNELARDPRHHFHAPIIPIIFWAAASGLANVTPLCRRIKSRFRGQSGKAADLASEIPLRFAAHFTWGCALAAGLFLSLSPAGISFWDSGSEMYWRNLYVPGKRAEMAERVVAKIPQSARVASTDFIHPRFTHYERSYDYSDYPRAVSNYELKVPDDTDYIVIDTQHPYSKIKSPDQVREYREHRDLWELLPDDTEGYFIVLKRRK